MTVKDQLKTLVTNFRRQQEINPEALKRAQRVIEAAKRESTKK